jgi:hypothetical protein
MPLKTAVNGIAWLPVVQFAAENHNMIPYAWLGCPVVGCPSRDRVQCSIRDRADFQLSSNKRRLL